MNRFNLMLCYFALGDRDKMRRGFQRLVALRTSGGGSDDDRYLNLQVGARVLCASARFTYLLLLECNLICTIVCCRHSRHTFLHQGDTQLQAVLDAIKSDTLRERERAERQVADRFIMLAAKLISPGV